LALVTGLFGFTPFIFASFPNYTYPSSGKREI